MSEKKSKSEARDQQRRDKLDRHARQVVRLSQALRTNLRLRKAQQRAREDMPVDFHDVSEVEVPAAGASLRPCDDENK